MSVKRPRLDPEVAAHIERVRGQVPMERFVNNALREVLARYTLDPKSAAELAGEESGLAFRQRRAMVNKMHRNAETGARPREGLSAEEERAFEIGGHYMAHMDEDARMVFRRLYWGG